MSRFLIGCDSMPYESIICSMVFWPGTDSQRTVDGALAGKTPITRSAW